ncbi:DUF3221 domain-containing protein [Gracilibacillus massiliensis]|uniref:DUF3221 domain-containing protein n=1 Tax=Gracilibacillus massiliensis TaxID=1564956 RepID=UPI00071DFE9C|nr:DUF3221 domain-containing protein [Gracilibacillus massiliensis]
MRFFFYCCAIIVMLNILIGCSNEGTSSDSDPEVEGYILEVEEDRILVAEDITSEKFEEIKNNTIQELDEERISLIYLSGVNGDNFDKGNHVQVWIEGGINTSYPGQAKAQEVEEIK